MRGTTSTKCTDDIRTYEGLQPESVQMRFEHVRDYKQKVYRRGTTSRKCTNEIRTCEGLQAESVPMRLEHVRDYKQKVYR